MITCQGVWRDIGLADFYWAHIQRETRPAGSSMGGRFGEFSALTYEPVYANCTGAGPVLPDDFRASEKDQREFKASPRARTILPAWIAVETTVVSKKQSLNLMRDEWQLRVALRPSTASHKPIDRARRSTKNMEPTAIVLHGPTSAGKSSLARALQDSSKIPVFHISLDAFVEMSRRRDMRSDEELNQALRLHYLNLQSTLRRVAASHFEIVLDLVLRDTTTIDECISALAPRRTYVVGVSCPLDVLEARERGRPDRSEGMARAQFGHPAYSRSYSIRLDTLTLPPFDESHSWRNYAASPC